MGATILSVLLGALKSIEGSLDGESLTQIRDDALSDLEQHIAKRASSSWAQPVADALLEYLEKHFPRLESTENSTPGGISFPESVSILTLSGSSSITSFLQQLASQSHFATIDLRVLKSRPLFEGVSPAASLVRYAQSDAAASLGLGAPTKIKVNIYTDASVSMAANGVDVVLLGADRIVSNKTGSLPAVLAAKRNTLLGQEDSSTSDRRTAKVIVLGETEKNATPGATHKHVVEDNDPTQLSRD